MNIIKKLLILPLVIMVTIGVNAQKPGKYNKFIKKGEYSQGLNYLNEKGGLSPRSYDFGEESQIVNSHAFNPNFNDSDYKTILSLANKVYKNIDYPDRSYTEVANSYLTKALHYLWKGDFEKAKLAHKEAKEKFKKFKIDENLNPKHTKVIERIIDGRFFGQLESHKFVKVLKDINIDNLNLSEEESYNARKKIKNLLEMYNNAPRKVLYFPFQNYFSNYKNDEGNLDLILRVGRYGDYSYFANKLLYNLTDKQIKQYFSSVDIYEIFGSDYKTKEQKENDSKQRKGNLVKKYGKKFGEAIFKGKILIGMPKELIKNELRKPREIDLSEYHEFWIWSDIMLTIDKQTQKVTRITNF